MRRYYSAMFVGVQLVTIAYLVFNGPVVPDKPIPLLLVVIGGVVMLWAIAVMMKRSDLRILPDIAEKAKLVTSGPYKFIRHPMYSGGMLVMIGLFINYLRPDRLIMALILIIDMILKLHYEESLWVKKIPEYKNYQRKTKKLIPYIY